MFGVSWCSKTHLLLPLPLSLCRQAGCFGFGGWGLTFIGLTYVVWLTYVVCPRFTLHDLGLVFDVLVVGSTTLLLLLPLSLRRRAG